jgi:hypothetical protein
MNTIEIQTTIKAQQDEIINAFNERLAIEIMGVNYVVMGVVTSFTSESLCGDRSGLTVEATLEFLGLKNERNN